MANPIQRLPVIQWESPKVRPMTTLSVDPVYGSTNHSDSAFGALMGIALGAVVVLGGLIISHRTTTYTPSYSTPSAYVAK